MFSSNDPLEALRNKYGKFAKEIPKANPVPPNLAVGAKTLDIASQPINFGIAPPHPNRPRYDIDFPIMDININEDKNKSKIRKIPNLPKPLGARPRPKIASPKKTPVPVIPELKIQEEIQIDRNNNQNQVKTWIRGEIGSTAYVPDTEDMKTISMNQEVNLYMVIVTAVLSVILLTLVVFKIKSIYYWREVNVRGFLEWIFWQEVCKNGSQTGKKLLSFLVCCDITDQVWVHSENLLKRRNPVVLPI